MNEFKDVLKLLRRERGLSQAVLAKELGITQSNLSMYESGERVPSYGMLEQIADFFNVDVDLLMGRVSKTEPEELSPLEKKIMEEVRAMNVDGKAKILDYINDIKDRYQL